MSTTTYHAKTITGAEREVRQLRKQLAQITALFEQAHNHRILFAKLAADGPAFHNPLEIYAAKEQRDEILKTWCSMKPNGDPL